MKPTKKQICVIGLGHFGASLAKSLAKHCEVLALDSDMNRVNTIADHVQRALCVDASDYQALASVVSGDFDEAVVSIGEGLEASILCTLHLRQIGIRLIRAKANNQDHAEILRLVGATHIVFPEQETAERLALQMVNPNLLDFIPLAEDYRVMDVAPPESFHGQSLVSLQLRKSFGLFVIAIKRDRGSKFVFLPGPEEVIQPDDVLVIIGRENDIVALRDPGYTTVNIKRKNSGDENREGKTESNVSGQGPSKVPAT